MQEASTSNLRKSLKLTGLTGPSLSLDSMSHEDCGREETLACGAPCNLCRKIQGFSFCQSLPILGWDFGDAAVSGSNS